MWTTAAARRATDVAASDSTSQRPLKRFELKEDEAGAASTGVSACAGGGCDERRKEEVVSIMADEDGNIPTPTPKRSPEPTVADTGVSFAASVDMLVATSEFDELLGVKPLTPATVSRAGQL